MISAKHLSSAFQRDHVAFLSRAMKNPFVLKIMRFAERKASQCSAGIVGEEDHERVHKLNSRTSVFRLNLPGSGVA